MPRRGLSFLSGAQQVPVQRRPKSLSQSKGAAPCFSLSLALRARLVGSHHRHRLRAPSLPSTRGALAPSGAAIMAPSLGATNSFTAVFAFDGDVLRNVCLVDKEDASVRNCGDQPITESYCIFIHRAA